MNVDWKLAVDFIKACAWPSVAVFALFLLRRPLVELVSQIGRRARKLSVYELSIELATLPELSSSWSIGSADVRQLTSSQIFDSPSETLFRELLKPDQADYAVVDLGAGQKWLTSRLFIFALILGSARGLRSFVFLESSNGVRKRFLGISAPSDVRRALAIRYPWLEEAYLRAAASQYFPIPPEVAGHPRFSNLPPVSFDANEAMIRNLVNLFVGNIQRITVPPQDEMPSHLEISTSPQAWERAHWIDGDRLERDLAGSLKYTWCQESPDKPESDLVEAISRRDGEFVALVDEDRRFIRLVDRYAVLHRISRENEKSKSQRSESLG
jgi:hypothetical protein